MAQPVLELWVIRGRTPRIWSVPFRIRWMRRRNRKEDVAEISYALELREAQRGMVDSALFNFIRVRRNGRRYIRRAELEKIGTRAENFDAEAYYEWGRERVEQQPKHDPEGRKNRDDLVAAVYESGITSLTIGELQSAWWAFCRQAMDFLINKERPVDMFFFTLHPSQYRVNWKILLLARQGGCTSWNRFLYTYVQNYNKPAPPFDLDRQLLSPDKFEIIAGQENLIARSVEVEHKRQWWKFVRLTEEKRLQRLGPCKYVQRVIESVKRRLPASKRIYADYVARMARSFGTFAGGDDTGGVRLDKAPSRVLTARYQRDFYGDLPIVGDGIPSSWEVVPASKVLDEDGQMPPVPPVQPPTQNMRNGQHHGGAHLEQSRNGAP